MLTLSSPFSCPTILTISSNGRNTGYSSRMVRYSNRKPFIIPGRPTTVWTLMIQTVVEKGQR